MPHLELRGHEYAHSAGKTNPEECCEQCTRQNKCGGFTYNKEEQFCRFKTSTHTSWLKTEKYTVHTDCDICVSWVKDIAHLHGEHRGKWTRNGRADPN